MLCFGFVINYIFTSFGNLVFYWVISTIFSIFSKEQCFFVYENIRDLTIVKLSNSYILHLYKLVIK